MQPSVRTVQFIEVVIEKKMDELKTVQIMIMLYTGRKG